MKDLTVLKYLLKAIDNNYIQSIDIRTTKDTKMDIIVFVSQPERIIPVAQMIEANMYVKSELLAKNTIYGKNALIINTFNDIEYNIHIKSK